MAILLARAKMKRKYEKINEKKPEYTLEEIISGEDISKNYLGETTQPFRIFRHQRGVYAVAYDENTKKPIDFVHMWNSHKGEKKRDLSLELGSGVYGKVFQKSEDKVFKVMKRTVKRDENRDIQKNLKILKQKFFLKEHNIEQYFILGLWHVKGDVFFNMPKVTPVNSRKFLDTNFKSMLDEFILALKHLNELGYSHPDLAMTPYHNSPQNICISDNGMRLIDLDMGLFDYKEEANNLNDKGIYVSGRDQWLYVYNDECPKENNTKSNWRAALRDWYKANPGRALSDNSKALLHLYKNNGLLLPPSFVNDMHNKNAEKSVSEYQAGSTENRKHKFHDLSVDDFQQNSYKQEYQKLKGDALKRAILNQLKDSLEGAKTEEEFEKIKTNFLASPEMTIIDKAQGKMTFVLGFLGFKTDSHHAVDKIFKEAKARISHASPKVS